MTAELAIAKASFAVAFLKPDPSLPSATRGEVEQFHGLLSAAVAQCSPTNVQKCKQWALQYLVSSPARVAALGKYLAALVNSFASAPSSAEQQASGGAPEKQHHRAPFVPSVKRRRLHVLYVLNDILFHVKHRTKDEAFFPSLEPRLPALFASAAAFTNCPKHMKKLHGLVDIWESKAYFPPPALEKLRKAIIDGPKSKESGANEADATKQHPSTVGREAPFLLPTMHGDASTPWYDLPAANWLPLIEPNSTRPMNPAMIRPLQLAGGPADKSLIQAVKKLLADVDKIYGKGPPLDGDTTVEISQMGEVVERDEINGEIVGGETYYGWSRAFCQKMKARRRERDLEGSRGRRRSSSRSSTRSAGPTRGRSSSLESSGPAFKRRRLSESRSRSPSRSRSRSRTPAKRGEYKSRSRSRRSYSPRDRRRRSPSRSRSRSPPRGLGLGHENSGPGSRSRSRSRSAQYSPPPANPPMPRQYGNEGGHNRPPARPAFNQPPFPTGQLPPPPPPLQVPQPGPGYGAWNVPPPPPPPPQYQGQWPPPPPPPPPPFPLAGGPQQIWYPSANASPQAWSSGWVPTAAPPPPSGPPPPQHQQPGGFQYGRGGNGGYRGRGGYGRGRGW